VEPPQEGPWHSFASSLVAPVPLCAYGEEKEDYDGEIGLWDGKVGPQFPNIPPIWGAQPHI